MQCFKGIASCLDYFCLKTGLTHSAISLMIVITTAMSSNEPSDTDGFNNNPTEFKYLRHSISQSEMRKPLEGEVKHLKASATKSSC